MKVMQKKHVYKAKNYKKQRCLEIQNMKMSQLMTKPTMRLVRPAETQISMSICTVWSVFADRMCLLRPPGYPKRDKREPLPYWVDVQAALSLCWSHRSYCRFCHALLKWPLAYCIYLKHWGTLTPYCTCHIVWTSQFYNFLIYSQTCVKQPPMGKPKTGCIRQVLA